MYAVPSSLFPLPSPPRQRLCYLLSCVYAGSLGVRYVYKGIEATAKSFTLDQFTEADCLVGFSSAFTWNEFILGRMDII